MARQIIDTGNSPNDGTGDPLRVGGDKINDNFTEVYGLLNNRVQINPVSIDWSLPVNPQILDYVNDVGVSVPKDVIKLLVAYKPVQSSSPFVSTFSVNYYLWTAGEGSFGTALGNTYNSFSWVFLSSTNTDQSTQYNLGEIGTTPIEDTVNGSGPYAVSIYQPTLFITTRSGADHVYLYIGNDTIVGLGEAQTTASDFVDLNEEPIPPIDPNDYVTNLKFDSSLYDTAETGFSTDLSNFTSLTGKFYFLRVSGEGDTVYFASKETNTEDFVGSRIYVSETGTKHDLGLPTVTQNGYHFWDIGVLPVVINPSSGDWSFQFWLRKRNDTYIFPNSYSGTDTEKIQKAVDDAALLGFPVYIGQNEINSDWFINEAILLPSGTTVIIENARIKMLDTMRDNIFRSNNIGIGISNPENNPLSDIHIIGVGKAIIEGADNPRSTGGNGKTLTLTSTRNLSNSYGSDAGVAGESQVADLRNIGVVFGYTENVSVSGILFRDLHCWGISFERCKKFKAVDLEFDCPYERVINGTTQYIKNTDGVNVRTMGEDGLIQNIKGKTADDAVAMTIVPGTAAAGTYDSMQYTGTDYTVGVDGVRNVQVSNIQWSNEYNIIRLLNTGNTEIKNVQISNIIDKSYDSWFKTGACIILGSSNASYGGPTPLGNCSNIFIDNVVSTNKKTGIRVDGSLAESTISNFVKHKPDSEDYEEPIVFTQNSLGARNVSVSNVIDVDKNTKLLSGVIEGNPAVHTNFNYENGTFNFNERVKGVDAVEQDELATLSQTGLKYKGGIQSGDDLNILQTGFYLIASGQNLSTIGGFPLQFINNPGNIIVEVYNTGVYVVQKITKLEITGSNETTILQRFKSSSNFGNWVKLQTNETGLFIKEQTITSTELTNSATTPVDLIPDPGVGKINVVEKVVGFMEAGTTPYDDDGLAIKYGNGVPLVTFSTPFNTGASDTYEQQEPGGNLQPNQPIQIGFNVDPTQGDATLHLKIYYRIEEF